MSKRRGPGKPKLRPLICKDCAFRLHGDAKASKEFADRIHAVRAMLEQVKEAVGRALDDAHEKCPNAAFSDGRHMACDAGECELDPPKGFVPGDALHPAWRCWTKWFEVAMSVGRYSKEGMENAQRKADPE